jgi:DNA-binding CsgD family transcriptional regulator
MPEEKRSSIERIITGFVPEELVGPYVKLHTTGMVPKDDAEEFLGGPEIVKGLTDRGLAHHAPHTPDTPASFRAAPIDLAMMAILADLKEQAALDHQRLLDGYDKLSEIKSWPRATNGSGREHLVRIITDIEEIMHLSLTMINSVEQDWMSLETLDSGMPLTEDFVVAAPPALRDGLQARSIYDQASLDDTMAAANLKRSMAAGEQARVLPVVPMKMQVFDWSAVLLALTPTASGGAMLIYAEPIVCGLREYFELLWQRAVPVGHMKPPPGCPLTEGEHDVLRLLARGMTDAAIQRQLKFGDSTMYRRVHSIMAHLQTTSRFAAGAAAQRRGWLDSSGEVNG